MPLLDRQLGDEYHLNIVGRIGALKLSGLAGPRVHFRGLLPDLENVYSQSRILVAPTRYAAGLPMKVHEAAAAGLPVVATRLLAEQLGWNEGVELLTATTAAEFAHSCFRLYTEEALWESVRANALRRIRKECDPAAFVREVRSVLAAVINKGPPSEDQ